MAKETVKKEKKTAAAAVNKAKVKYPEKFTAQTIANYISEKHELPKARAKELIEDLFDVISEGAMKGERVPMGKFGKIFIKMKPATKARMGRNPITGEEIKIAAKKATKVPKFTFSKSYKEQALTAKIKK
ncbi:MAG TPA: HU family DNA-binding protein [Spirochaetota bacterium]|nr:HU family DNA-binding protein [Spirochaetota bacterium]HQO03651.1 HU family DNA-binding protein [Spirochaetota bacterium]HQP48863.1 HU family DNA-binding protein [Spirochaetota bacterium]